jgi:hypothetical protein
VHYPHPRWKVTVSITSRTTETRLASSAPPERETMLAVCTAVMPCAEISLAQIRYQTGGQVHGADLGTITEFQYGGDQADSQCGK